MTTRPEADVAHGARDPDQILLGFARALRAAGVPVTPDRGRSYLDAVALVGLGVPDAVRAAGHATLCGSPDDLVRHDHVFEAYFDPRTGLPRAEQAPPGAPTPSTLPLTDPDADAATDERDHDDHDADVVRAMASATEVLRHRDVAGLTAAERRRLGALIEQLRARPPQRRTVRQRSWHRGRVDAPRTLRASLRRMGEPGEIAWRRRATRPRRVVLLVDVSGSMSGYADVVLRVAHRLTQGARATGGVVETFTVGTRLTHLTRALQARDPERALVAAGDAVPDWSGGTRLGETLAVFADRWGRRGAARGAVVVIVSDGWERGDPAALAEQVERLHRVAHRVVWVNPHRGKAGYEPLQGGVVAALPHCDDFLAGHSLATYAELVEVVAHA